MSSADHPKINQQGSGVLTHSGFTLLELLVVIAVICILMGLFLGALATAKSKARAVQCTANHKSLIVGWISFTGDHEDGLPLNNDLTFNMKDLTNWVCGNLQDPFGKDDTNSALLVDPDKSQLAPYVGSAKVFKCPGDPSVLVRSVSMNNRMNPVKVKESPLLLEGKGTNYMIYRKLTDIGDPSSIFVFLDERFDSINEGYFAVDMSNTGDFKGNGVENPYYWIDTPASYHNKAAVFAFADGHIEPHRWLERSTYGPIGITGARHTSSTDRDIQWVQRHCTEPKQ